MKKKMYNDEELLRDKMLRHEFPADERAWGDMENMLNGTQPVPDLAPATLPAASAPVTLHAALIWMAGLGLASLLTMLAMGQQGLQTAPHHSTEPATLLPEHRENTAYPRATGQSAAHTARSAADVEVAQSVPIRSTEVPTGPIFLEKNSTSRSFSPKNGTSGTPAASITAPASQQPQPAKPVASANTSEASAYDAPSSPVRKPDSPTAAAATAAAAPSEQSTSQESTPEGSAASPQSAAAALPPLLSALPKSDLPALHVKRTLQMPKAATPTPPSFHEQRFQVGAALGGQWAIVNRSTNKIDLLPTFGITLMSKVAPRWWGETGLMWRKVRGYELSAMWDASGIGANGQYGSWARRVSASEIVFVEMPLLAKYALRNGDQRLMAGVRFARLLLLNSDNNNFTSTVNSFAPKQEFSPTIGDGIRRHDLALTVGVEARIFRNFWADIRHSQGLYDLTYDSFFGNTTIDRTAETQLTLRYYFWSF